MTTKADSSACSYLKFTVIALVSEFCVVMSLECCHQSGFKNLFLWLDVDGGDKEKLTSESRKVNCCMRGFEVGEPTELLLATSHRS